MAGASFSESPSSGLVDSESIVRKMIQSRKSFSYAPRSMVRNTNRPAALRVASPAFERGGGHYFRFCVIQPMIVTKVSFVRHMRPA